MNRQKADIKETTKKSVEDLVSQAKISEKTMNASTVIPECEVYTMPYLLGDTAGARGAAVIMNTYKDDKEIYELFQDASMITNQPARLETDLYLNAFVKKDRGVW